MAETETTLSLGEIARRLDQAGIAWVVFAGAAASVYGATRPLTDVDILLPAAAGDQVWGLFPEGRVIRRGDGSIQMIQLTGFDLVVGIRWPDSDAARALDLDAAMVERLQHHELLGVIVPVIPPEDNILLKAVWGRGPEVGKHDWEDVEAMMAHLQVLDWEYLRQRAEACAPARRLGQIWQRLENLGRRGEQV